ncbi:MAG: glycoside hydrolase family 15 protein [Moorellaceae bacterium]
MKRHQTDDGAFPAAPNFAPYRYVWLRDGTFIAYALDLAGEKEAAGAFYAFMASTILRYSHKIEASLAAASENRPLHDDICLHTRYTLEGTEGQEPWGNFQLDGYGTFLWGLSAYLARGGRMEEAYREAIWQVTRYLCGLWQVPCLDCWEEHGECLHPSTLAAIYGGLQAVLPWLTPPLEEKALATLKAIPEKISQEYVVDGHFVKFAGYPEVDANLLWLALPFKVYPVEDPRVRGTVEKIEQDLRGGGVKRYRADTYYGGGEWPLLACWLAWYYLLLGRRGEAGDLLEWVEAQADEEGHLPEQVPHNLTSVEYYHYWVQRWGPVARPLLWSHAMYIIARLSTDNCLSYPQFLLERPA